MTVGYALQILMHDPDEDTTTWVPPAEQLWTINTAVQYIHNVFMDKQGPYLQGFDAPTTGSSGHSDALGRLLFWQPGSPRGYAPGNYNNTQ